MKKNSSFFLCFLFVLSTFFAKAQIGTNIDFGTGTIAGWNYDEGINANSLTMTTVSGFSASTAYSVMAPGSTEALGLPITMTSPLGGDFVRVGRPTLGGYVGRLSQTFTVPTGTTGLLVSYAMVLENAAHACTDNPYFYLTLRDASGNAIPGTSFYSSNASACSSFDPGLSTFGSYSYKNWTTTSYDLSAYMGTSVTLEVWGAGCVQTGHLGYCYFDAQVCNGSSTPSTLMANGVNYSLPSVQNYLSICGSSSVTVTAPSGATSYQWSGTGITGLTTQSVSITQSGVYQLVFNKPSACSPTTAVTFTVSGTGPTVSVAASNSVVCAGAAVTLTASGASNYTWAPAPNSLTGSTTQQGTYTPSVTNTYTIIGSDANGCRDTASYQVSVLASPTLAVTGNTAICSGSSTTLSVTGANTYTWSTGSNATSIVVSPTVSTNYSVMGKVTSSGCTQSSTYHVTVYSNSLTLTPSPSNVCAGSSVTITASGAASYTWSANAGGANTASVVLTPTGLTSYTVSGTNLCGVISKTFTLNTIPTPTLTVTGPDSLCYAPSVTFTASGASSYAWTSYGNVSTSSGTGPSYAINLLQPAPYTFTVNCVGTGANGCTASFTRLVKVLASPVLSIASSSVGCSGSPVTLTASGASTYTWSANAGGVNTASTIVTPTATTGYMVSGTGSNGCSGSTTTTVVINTTTLSISPTAATICPGHSLTLSASGASTYTWSTGAGTPSIVVTPTTTTTYTVGGTSSCGTFTNSVQITVYPMVPPVFISGPDSLCLTSSVTFTAIGSGATYAWSTSGGFIGSSSGTGPSYSVNLNPPAPYTFTVNCVATSTNGCTSATATKQVKVLAYPFISVSGPTVVCQYSSGTLLAIGANSYTWSTGANTASINVTPTVSTSYTVIGESSGCTSNIDTVLLTVDNTCEDVWPGDANSDGTADNTDILELGLHYTQTGPARASVSNAWQSFYAADWTGTITNGQNLNHSDCNGDGTVDASDTLAVYLNYGLTHAFKQAQATSNAQLTIVPDQPSLNPGDWGSASIFLGDAASQVNNINGVAFTVNFDQAMIAPGNVYLEYPVSFINAANQNLHFRKLDFGNGVIYTATTHTLSNNVSGNGKIAVLHFLVDPSLSQGVLNIGLSQGNQSSANGAITPLTTGGATLAITGTPTTGVNELVAGTQTSVYPNPATDAINISSSVMLQKVELLSLTGQMVMSQPASGRQCQLKLSGLEEGIYFVNVYSAGHIVKREKIVIQRR